MIRFLNRSFIALRYVFVPMFLFLGLALVALVIKSSVYVFNIFNGITTDSLGRVLHYALSLLDVTLVMGLLFLIMGYILFTFVVGGSDAEKSIPQWCRERFLPKSNHKMKLQIAVTVLLIATIDLLGEFVSLSDLHIEEVGAVSSRLWLMLGLYCALVITAIVLTIFVKLTSGSSAEKSDEH